MTHSPHKKLEKSLVTDKFDRFNRSSNAISMLKLALLQMVSTLAFSGVMYYCYGTGEALSAFFGGSIWPQCVK